MEKMTFSTSINAPKEKVWETLWDDASYRQWTLPFCDGSYLVTDDYKEGSKILFMAPDNNGMVSKVAANRPNEFMSFEHQGEVKNGVEDTTSDAVKAWAGAHENYTLSETDGATELLAEVDITDDFKGYFEKIFPLALENVKALAEGNPVKNGPPKPKEQPKVSEESLN
ncbi:MAG: SRPBCC domain-containing protein [Bacteroidota bacterium]